ncbi:sensor histidine kinase [Nocardioides sp.]|uniref:sensor histidine kinase n=1 Tax=Nocardioides sp. TaxID=35761 RepID=UPI0039E3A19E
MQAVSFAALEFTDRVRTTDQVGWMAVADVVMLGALVLCRVCDQRGPFRLSPVATGVALGAGIGLLRTAFVATLPDLTTAFGGRVLISVFGVSLSAGLIWMVRNETRLPRWVAVRLAAAVLWLCTGRTVICLDPGLRHPGMIVVALLCTGLAAVCLVSAGVVMLRHALAVNVQRTSNLLEELEQVESDQRLHRARMHEVESTMAGIRSATELLRDADLMTPERRQQMEDLIYAEVCRLQRLLGARRDPAGRDRTGAASQPSAAERIAAAPQPRPVTSISLDETLAALATIHGARGTTVTWSPSGTHVRGDADEITEVLNILFDNAARHGDASASVAVRQDADSVEILVTNSGPGIAPEVRERLFEWGARSAGSPGQGIGLHIAQSLAAKQGGYLRLSEPARSERDLADPAGRSERYDSTPDEAVGITFAVGLPAAS